MPKEGSLKRQLPAGVIDSGFASLATFVVAIAAVTLFDDVDRGVYAIFFTSFVAGSLLANELIFTPAEVEAVAHPLSQRLSLVPQSLRLGIGPALVGALAAPVSVVITAGYAESDLALGLAVTSGAAIVLSPMQDHVRRMLHIAGVSWRAASVSIVQFVVVAACMGIGVAIDVPIAWLPFGVLVVANATSLVYARVLAQVSMTDRATSTLRFLDLASTGIWFLLNAAPAVVWFATTAVIAALASPEALGFAESARVVAQPVAVFAGGLTAVLTPRAMRAAMDSDLADARRSRTVYLASMGLAGVAYLAIAGWDWVLNPMAYIVPSAYELNGLAALSIVAAMALSASFLQSDEIAGARRVRTLALISWLSSLAGLLAGLTAPITGAFARPIAGLAGAGAKYVPQAVVLARLYRTDSAKESGDPPAVDAASPEQDPDAPSPGPVPPN